MRKESFRYIILGAGVAGASAVEGIREMDPDGSILMIGREPYLPYHRPPLSKKLWLGKEKVQDIFVHDQGYYAAKQLNFQLQNPATRIDPLSKEVTCENGAIYRFEKLLLAMGGEPRRLSIPGGDQRGICYYRNLADYTALREKVPEGTSALVVGGGFIGSELAAALNMNKVSVTMLFPDKCLVQRVFPESLALAVQERFADRGIRIVSGDLPISMEGPDGSFVTRTRNGRSIESQALVVGVGIRPSMAMANTAGIDIGDGVIVNEYLQSSHSDIYAAGDLANYPDFVLDKRRRVEHWDNAIHQGKLAGRNMAGAHESYGYMPYFFSDLFEFGYEAVGEVDSRLEIVADWQEENSKGVVYYLKEGRVRGAMMCNVWGKLDWARDLIKRGVRISQRQLPRVA